MLYSEKVMDHFRNPRNVGEMENPDGVGEVGNAKCGDIMRMYIKVDNGKITKVLDIFTDGVSCEQLNSDNGLKAGGKINICILALNEESIPTIRAFSHMLDALGYELRIVKKNSI